MTGCDEPGVEGRIRAAVVVAHPDDETLWAGGTLLVHPQWRWVVVTLCRASDPDRAPRFARAVERLGATGRMADLDDGPAQVPLDATLLRKTLLSLMGDKHFDLLLTHSPHGEYTRHLRHEETGAAVLGLWETGELPTDRLWMFAYEDGGGRYPPRPIPSAHRTVRLPDEVWRKKQAVITDTYGFAPGSFEVNAASRVEAFWTFDSPSAARRWLDTQGGAS